MPAFVNGHRGILLNIRAGSFSEARSPGHPGLTISSTSAGSAWRIIPVSRWLITMVSKSPKDRVVEPLPNGLNGI